MKRPIVALGLAVLALAGGCASNTRATSWQGRNVNDLMMAWGPPDSMQRASDGRQMISYQHQHFVSGNSYQCKAWFIADAEGTILKANVDGNIGGCNGLLGGRPAAPGS